MKLSDRMKNNMIEYDDAEMMSEYAGTGIAENKLLPEIEKLEQQNKELLEALIRHIKLESEYNQKTRGYTAGQMLEFVHNLLVNNHKSIELIEKTTGKTWEQINEN